MISEIKGGDLKCLPRTKGEAFRTQELPAYSLYSLHLSSSLCIPNLSNASLCGFFYLELKGERVFTELNRSTEGEAGKER